jgi:histidinol-phosphate aminotransferase
LGWGYAHPSIIDILNRIRPPFNITAPTIAAGIAAVNDQDFVKKCVEHNSKWIAKLSAELTELGFTPTPSQANFIMAKMGNSKEDTAKAFNFLASKGILVREIYNYNLPEFLRISIGSDEEMNMLIAALREFKAS